MNSNKDVSGIIRDWEYQPGQTSARKIKGRDGKERIQMRIELGLLQMETQGRPDGERPHGKASLLDYHLSRLDEYRAKHGATKGFKLNKDECEGLYREALQYYQRYLSLFSLKDYGGVVRDTERNLRAHNLAESYAVDEEYRGIFTMYVPYIIMMNAKAKALMEQEKKKYNKALTEVKRGIQRIDDFLSNRGQSELSEKSEEIASLRELGEEIRRKKPLTELDRLKLELEDAVKREDFEKAAKLRDVIKKWGGEE